MYAIRSYYGVRKMKKSINFIVAILGCAVNLFGQIPLIPHVNSADPSGHVWPDDPETLWIYASHDIPGTDSHKTMAHYHVYSSKDLVHWTDYVITSYSIHYTKLYDRNQCSIIIWIG